MRVETAQKLGMALLEALGIEPKGVTGLTLTCNVGEVPTIAVTTVVPEGAGESARRVLRTFRLSEPEEVSLGPVDESVSLESSTRTTHRPVVSPEAAPT